MHPLDELEKKARQLADGGEPERSVETYKELLRLAPNWEHGLGCYELAYTLEQMNRYDEALQYYQQAIAQRTHDSYFWYGYADLAARRGDAQDALKYLLQILRESPDGYPKDNLGKLLSIAGLRANRTQATLLREVQEITTDPDIMRSLVANWSD